MKEIHFPNWDAVLARTDLPERLRNTYQITIRWYLSFCRRSRAGVNHESARGFIEWAQQEKKPEAWQVEQWKEAIPFQRHDAFPSQSRCHLHFLRISLAPPLQVLLPPTPASEFLHYNPLGLFLPSLLPFCPIVTLPNALGHLRQQFLAKSPVP